MQKLCPFYKFQRDFANKVEIHICKFSQQLDHISHGKLILFYFFDISIIFFYFFLKLKRRSTGGVHSVLGQVSNGTPWGGAPLPSLIFFEFFASPDLKSPVFFSVRFLGILKMFNGVPPVKFGCNFSSR